MFKEHSRHSFFPIFGVTFILSCTSVSAESIDFKVGLGKVSLENTSPVSNLTTQGYTVNSYQSNKIDEGSSNVGVVFTLSPRINVEMTLQELGKVKSTLDLQLPTNKTSQQAAADVASASSQQLGGLYVALGANYVRPVLPRVNFRVGAGLLVGKNNHQITINSEDIDVSENIYAPFIKLGTGINATQKISVTAHIERYFLDDSVNRYEIGLQYSFR